MQLHGIYLYPLQTGVENITFPYTQIKEILLFALSLLHMVHQLARLFF